MLISRRYLLLGNKHVLHTIDIGLFLDSFLKTGSGAVATGGYTRD